MAKYTIESDTLTDIADAIREQSGDESPVSVTNMAEAIRNINGSPKEEPELMDIPKVFWNGVLPTAKADGAIKGTFMYSSKTDTFSGYATLKVQGNSSASYPKKNFTIQLYDDEDLTVKAKADFKGWGKQSKFVIKADWIDISHARNVVSARIWGDIVRSRSGYESLPELMKTTPNSCAIDGFPVKFYVNGTYWGRYDWTIPKDKWAFNMDSSLDEHCVLCGENYVSACFRASAKIDETDWSDEIHDTVPESIKTRWNEVISFVMNSTDAEFVSGIENYFDLESLIDYYIYAYASCGLDSLGKNQIYLTYDGLKWYASMYDMDSTWGLYWNGQKFVSTTYKMPEEYEVGVHNTSNLLYDRLIANFKDAVLERYTELRSSVLTVGHLITRFERFTDIASTELVAEDYASTTGLGKFTGIPSKTTNNIQQIRAYIKDRLAYVDSMMYPATLVSITATKTKTTYNVGDTYSSADISVTATYDNGTTKSVTGFTVSPTTVDTATVGNTTLTVSYTEDDVTKTTTLTVEVKEAGQKILQSITATKSKTSYNIGETYSSSDISVTATYSDETTAVVTGFTVEPTTVDTSVEGNTTLTISYTEGSVTKTSNITITVADGEQWDVQWNGEATLPSEWEMSTSYNTMTLNEETGKYEFSTSTTRQEAGIILDRVLAPFATIEVEVISSDWALDKGWKFGIENCTLINGAKYNRYTVFNSGISKALYLNSTAKTVASKIPNDEVLTIRMDRSYLVTDSAFGVKVTYNGEETLYDTISPAAVGTLANKVYVCDPIIKLLAIRYRRNDKQ